ncbi:hypothetical protein B0H10DRAFT_2068346 [Mycena sp. CBHHK59/15]|nr:hypothetical protein B0H10DRAFT_2068346 [Mycena sp. CBHHK59/15]
MHAILLTVMAAVVPLVHAEQWQRSPIQWELSSASRTPSSGQAVRLRTTCPFMQKMALTFLFSASVNSTSVTWTPVNGVGATAEVPISFNIIIQDRSLFSTSRSTSEKITAGSIAVDSSCRCANAPVYANLLR